MAERDLYTSAQLEKIRATLAETLGEESSQALDNLDKRFSPKEEVVDEGKDGKGKKDGEEKVRVDVNALVTDGRLKRMIDALGDIKESPEDRRTVVAAILKHREVKAFHLVEALSKVPDEVDLVDALVQGITSLKGVNPLIDALRYAVASPEALKSLAKGIAEQGTVNHLIRAIATSPRGQSESEVIWAMEVMGKGTLEQILEAMNLMDADSPGTVVLATGLVHRKEVAVEPLVRALASCKGNSKAETILSVELTKLADVQSLVTLLEKYISDSSEAGEVLVARLVHSSLGDKGRQKLLAKAARFVKANSLSGKMLAMGVVELGEITQMEQAYNRMVNHPTGQRMIAAGIVKKQGGLKALRVLGGIFFQVSKYQQEVKTATKEASQRYSFLVKEVLGEDPNEYKVSARQRLAEKLKGDEGGDKG